MQLKQYYVGAETRLVRSKCLINNNEDLSLYAQSLHGSWIHSRNVCSPYFPMGDHTCLQFPQSYGRSHLSVVPKFLWEISHVCGPQSPMRDRTCLQSPHSYRRSHMSTAPTVLHEISHICGPHSPVGDQRQRLNPQKSRVQPTGTWSRKTTKTPCLWDGGRWGQML